MAIRLFKEIQTWRGGLHRYLQYDWKLTAWINLNRWRRLKMFVKRHSGVLRRLLLLVAASFAGWIATRYGPAALSKDTLTNYLVAVGAMAGGTIAIIFSISVFLLQGVADLYSSRHFEEYTNSWRDQIIYAVVILITFGFFGGALLVGASSAITGPASSRIIVASLFFIGVVFSLIDWQYESVRRKVSPLNAILFLQKKGHRFVRDMEYNAGKVADLISARDDSVAPGMALAAAYTHVLQPFINYLDKHLESLVEVSLKLSDRQENETAKRGLTAVHALLVQFLKARRTSSIAIPTGPLFLASASDSQTFLSSNFERLNKAAEKFVSERKEENATHIISIYTLLAVAASDVEFVGQSHTNPILATIVGYLSSLVESGQRSKNLEVVFQGVGALGETALVATNAGLADIVFGIQDTLLKIAMFGLSEKHTIVVDRCVSSYLRIIAAAFESRKVIASYQFAESLKHLATIAQSALFLVKSGYLPDNFSTRLSVSKGYSELPDVIARVANRYFQLTDYDDREKARYRSDIVKLCEELTSSLRRLSEGVEDCDSNLADSIGRLMFVNQLIVELISRPEFGDETGDLRTRLAWNVHLPYWFVRHAKAFDGGSNHFHTLTDSVAKTGIVIAERLEDRKLVTDCVDSLSGIATESLAKTRSGYGYDEPRVFVKACYLGILALKKGWRDVVAVVNAKAGDFETKYWAKYRGNFPAGIDPENHNVSGLPQKDQLFRELMRWRYDFESDQLSHSLGLRDDAEAMMYELVDAADIDRFLFETWGRMPSDSPVWAEVEERRRKELVDRLIKLLNDRAAVQLSE